MKRIVALLLMVLLLTGCGGGDTQPDPTLPPMTDLPTSFEGLGGKMPEMTVNTADGRTLKLTEILKEKELVVLNFWYEDCPWCVKEFPVMEVAYQNYREDVEILALNPNDGPERVKNFQQKHSLSFPMVACPISWATECGIGTFPTTILIDRDGVVCLIHTGVITTSYTWEKIFKAFLGDDYQRRIYTEVDEILK